MNGSVLKGGLVIVWLLGNLLVAAVPPSVETPTILLVLCGGLRFLLRNSARMTFDIPAVVLGGVASVAFVLLAHWLLRNFAKQRPDAPPWKWRWTLAALGTVILMFTAGVSFVGLAHQSLWLAGSKQPMYEEVVGRWRYVDNRTSLTNLKLIGFGFNDFHDTYYGFPGPKIKYYGKLSWEASILPFLHYYPEGLNADEAWESSENRPVFTKPIIEFLNPAFAKQTWFNRDGYALSHFAANERVIGPQGVATHHGITDGLAETILVGEINELRALGQAGELARSGERTQSITRRLWRCARLRPSLHRDGGRLGSSAAGKNGPQSSPRTGDPERWRPS